MSDEEDQPISKRARKSDQPAAASRQHEAAATAAAAAATSSTGEASSASAAAAAAAAVAAMNTGASEKELQLQASLYASMVSICDAEQLAKGIDPGTSKMLLWLLNSSIASMAVDLRAFARHANRTTISVDDVLLCARRNDGLAEFLRGFMIHNGITSDNDSRQYASERE